MMADINVRNGRINPTDTASSTADLELQQSVKGDPLEFRPTQHQSTADVVAVVLSAPPTGRQVPKRNQMPRHDDAAYRRFRWLCDRTVNELQKIDDFLDEDEVTDEGLEVVVEVEALLEKLYDCPWGKGESLKRVIVAIQSQVSNAQWKRSHVAFLKEIGAYLRVRYVIDEHAVNDCYEMIKKHRLDPFRGTVTEPVVTKEYRIEEVKEE